jgi:hypothetical protein
MIRRGRRRLRVNVAHVDPVKKGAGFLDGEFRRLALSDAVCDPVHAGKRIYSWSPQILRQHQLRSVSICRGDIQAIVAPKYSESSVMIEVDPVLSAPEVGPSTAARTAGRAVLLV